MCLASVQKDEKLCHGKSSSSGWGEGNAEARIAGLTGGKQDSGKRAENKAASEREMASAEKIAHLFFSFLFTRNRLSRLFPALPFCYRIPSTERSPASPPAARRPRRPVLCMESPPPAIR